VEDDSLSSDKEEFPNKEAKGRSMSCKPNCNLGIRKSIKKIVRSPWEQKATYDGKSSVRRELEKLNLSASKQYAFLYEDNDLDSAWYDPDVYNTRSRGGRARDERPSSGRQDRCCRKGQKPCPGEYVPLVVALGALLIVLLFGQRTQYCTTTVAHTQPTCSYDGWYHAW